VEKEEPRALVVAGKLYYMNRFGKVFKEVGPNEAWTSRSSRESHRRSGQTKADGLCHAGSPVSGIPERSLVSQKSFEIHVRKNGDVCLYFSFLPAAVKLRAQDLESKMQELKRVVEYLNSTGRTHTVKAIHLNYDQWAVVSFKKG